MAVVINGTTGISGVDGSAGTPALQGTDTNTGIFYGVDTVSIATNGATALTADSSSNIAIANNLSVTGTTTQTGQLLTSAGTAGAPAIARSGDADNGIFFPATNTMAISTAGTEDMRFTPEGNVTMNSATFSPTTPGTAGNLAMTGTLAMGSSFKRNRIINGNMVIDQRNAGASVTLNATTQYPVDRFSAYEGTSGATVTAQQSTTAPTGFTNSIIFTVSTGATPAAGDINGFWQSIEGFNIADLGWGTASAQSITLSFWVRSSVTGTYSFSLNNSAVNRFYVATYSVNVANTWEYKTVTIAGDTSGTWLTNNSVGIQIIWDIGYGTNFNGTAGSWGSSTIRRTSGSVQLIATTGATFYITGVQLEVGSVATPYEQQIYSDQLAQCQRYFQFGGYNFNGSALNGSTTSIEGSVPLNPPMRSAPAVSLTSGVSIQIRQSNVTADYTASSPALANTSTTNYGILTQISGFTGLTQGLFCTARNNSGASQMNFLSFSSEL